MSSAVRHARVITTALSVDRMLEAVKDPSVGGIGVFVGVIRDADEGHDVVSLNYTAHPLAEDRLRTCAEEVAARFDVVSVAVEHRIGHLVVGDLAVVVAVGAVHRGQAIDACRALIDDLKQQVPIWKEQQFTSGSTEWVGLS